MANRQQMNRVFPRVKRIYHPIVANSQTIAVASGQMIMRKSAQAEPHLVDFRLHPLANIRRKPQERDIEAGMANPQSGAHAIQGLRVRGRMPAFISRSDSRMSASNSGVKSNSSSTKSLSQSRIFRSSAGGKLFKSFSICSILLISNFTRNSAACQPPHSSSNFRLIKLSISASALEASGPTA